MGSLVFPVHIIETKSIGENIIFRDKSGIPPFALL